MVTERTTPDHGEKWKLDAELDFELDQTFPASDPLTITRSAPDSRITASPWAEASSDATAAARTPQSRDPAHSSEGRASHGNRLIPRTA